MSLFKKIIKMAPAKKEEPKARYGQYVPQYFKDQEKDGITRLRPYPFSVGSANLRYKYEKEIVGVDSGSVKRVLGNAEKVVDVRSGGGKIELQFNGETFAYVPDGGKLLEMVEDYEKRDDPVNAVLLADGRHINLRFYRDLRKGAENREQEVFKLSAYGSSDAQDAIACVGPGDEVSADEDNGWKVFRAFSTECIGKLPSKIARRAEEEGAYALYYERTDEEINDNCETVFVPYVRIYW